MKRKENYNKPILFLIFNRLETTRRVFDEIKKIKPRELYIAADGPRKNRPGEKERCEEVRKITEEINWRCEVKRLYRKNNLGCKLAVSKAIDWFFKNVDEGIILEDDCLPNPSFFDFCEKMLKLYRDDNRVMCISGDNFLPKKMQKKDDYYFSKYVHIWGWATWRRVWKRYDVKMESWPNVKREGKLNKYFSGVLEKTYWQTLFDAVYNNKIDTWDYQFVYSVWRNGGVSIMPNINLISNIGFDSNALHTKSRGSFFSKMDTGTLNTNLTKEKVSLNYEADDFSRKNVFNINLISVLKQKLYYSLIGK